MFGLTLKCMFIKSSSEDKLKYKLDLTEEETKFYFIYF